MDLGLAHKPTNTIDINIPDEMAEDLTQRAKSMYLSVSEYCEIILLKWVESGDQLRLNKQA